MSVHRFASYDEAELAYRVVGDGPPLVCVPGGPGRASEYLGDLGGLSATRQLILLDPRGVGASDSPADPASLHVDQLVRDVEALRVHLGLQRFDLLAHSAGSVLGTLYAAAHPQRVSRLILITPGLTAVGVYPSEGQFDAVLKRLSAEPWYQAAHAALVKILSGNMSMDAFSASRPLFYGRWDDAARTHAALGFAEREQAAREGYFADYAVDPATVRTALKELAAPVLLYAGDADPLVTSAMVHEAAALFHDATVIVQPEAGHFPWVDDPAAFAAAVGSFAD